MSPLPALTADLTQAIAALSAPTPDPDLVIEQAEAIERRLAGLRSQAVPLGAARPDEWVQVQRLFERYAGMISMRQGQVGRSLNSLGLTGPTYQVGSHGSNITPPRQLRMRG